MTWFKWLMLIGKVAEEYTAAQADDKRITVEEGLAITANVAQAAGIQFDDKGSALVVDLVTRICEMAADGVITIREIIAFTEELCNKLGIDFDRQGITID